MPNIPPFKLAAGSGRTPDAVGAAHRPACCEASEEPADAKAGRMKLAELGVPFQCSIIGTCMTTAALRKVMSRFIHVLGASDVDIHHDAVSMASEPGPASKALHKALDQQHAAQLLRFARITDVASLGLLWEDAMRNGDIPGAYWSLMTHRHTSTELRKKVFGDVHMLSHLVGAANRADIRRLVALEKTNADLRQQLEGQQERNLAQDLELRRLQHELAEARQASGTANARETECRDDREQMEKMRLAADQIALQTQRRAAAEQAAASARNESSRLAEEVAFVRRHATALSSELAATESQFRDLVEQERPSETDRRLRLRLAGRRILYVGGRPSSTPSIRALVERHLGDFRHHDGGLEDRKGLLTANVRWAETVVFPVDCVDHDSVGVLKRLCIRNGIEFLPLRSAGLGSFAASIAGDGTQTGGVSERVAGPCLKHG